MSFNSKPISLKIAISISVFDVIKIDG